MIEEVIYISAFNVKADGTIEVRKTTDVTKDGAVIATSYWRTVLQPHDPAADEVLGQGYYRDLATSAWASFPVPAEEPAAEEVVVEEPAAAVEDPIVEAVATEGEGA